MIFFGEKKEIADTRSGPDWPAFIDKLKKQATDPLLKHFYNAGIVKGDTPLSEINFVAVDLETTGLDPSKNDIISIGLVPFTLSRIYCNQAQHWVVKPRKPLQDNSIVIHGITHSDILNAPDFSYVLEDLLLAITGKVVVVHYRSIERDFIDLAVKARLGEGLLFPVIDTLEIESWFYRKPKQKFWSKMTGYPLQSIRLADSRKRYNLPFYHGHNALIDAISTAELLQAQIANRFKETDPVNAFWC